MKFNVTQQQVFPSLVTLFITSAMALYALLSGGDSRVELIPNESLLYGYIAWFQTSHIVWSAIIATLLIFISATSMGRIVSTQNIYGRTTSIQIPLLGVLLWSVSLGGDFLLSAVVIFIFSQVTGGLLSAMRVNSYMGHLFNASLALAVLPTIYPSALLMWGVMPLVLIFGRFTLREWIAMVVGLLLPIALLSHIYWLAGHYPLFVVHSILEGLLRESNIFHLENLIPLRMAIWGVGILLSWLSVVWFGRATHRSRLRLSIVMLLLFASLLTLLSPSATLVSFTMAAPTIAILSSLTMTLLPARMANIIYSLLFVLLFAAMFIPLYLPL